MTALLLLVPLAAPAAHLSPADPPVPSAKEAPAAERELAAWFDDLRSEDPYKRGTAATALTKAGPKRSCRASSS